MSQILVTGEAKIRDIQGPVVANSGVITALDGAASQYVRGDGTLADFPTSGGGGSSVSYYLNGSVNQGTFGGSTYYQMSRNAIVGTGTNFSTSANGLIAQFITDANDPDVVSIPSGNWNVEFFMSVSASSGALASFYVEIYKYNGSTFTLLATNVATPEQLTNTTTVDAYFTSVAMPLSSMAVTDRLAIRVFANVASKTVTLYTEDNRLCQIVTTFSKGMLSMNNLTDQSQYLTTGTSGTNFAIVSSGDTHTFNLPVASATNTGKLSSTDWSTFNGKVPYTGAIANVDLGSFELNAILVKAITLEAKLNGTASGNLVLRTGTNGYGFGNNAFSLASSPDYDNTLLLISNKSAVTKTALFNINSLTADRTYTFPDASGTIALTSNINYPVTSVFGRTGAVVAASGDYTTTQVTEGTNLYFTDARARAALSFTAGSGAYNSTTGVITIPTNNNQITNGAGYITSSALSGYVPYTGATTNVNLGANSLTANQVIVGGAGVNNAGTFTTYDGGVATQLIGSTGNLKFFPFWNPSVGARINAENSAGSAYIPLTISASTINLGGALSGTSATFSDIITNTTGGYRTSASQGYILRNDANSASLGGFTRRSFWAGSAALDTQIFAETGYGIFLNVNGSVTTGINILSSGNVGIGTSSPSQRLTIAQTNGYPIIDFYNSGTGFGDIGYNAGTSTFNLSSYSSTPLAFYTNASERMRISPAGYLKQRANGGSYFNGSYNEISNLAGGGSDINLVLGLGGNSNNTSSYFLICAPNNAADRLYILGNGNVINTNGSYGTISSDRRLKENIVSATPKLDDILKLNVVNFNLIGNEEKHIGFIAQEMQEVFPSFVYQNDTRKYDDDGNLISGLEDALGVKVGMEFAILVKAIQEQTQIIKDLEARIKQLENK
jgi:hypothetical protein